MKFFVSCQSPDQPNFFEKVKNKTKREKERKNISDPLSVPLFSFVFEVSTSL